MILVMKDGDIIEQGTHDSLLAEGGFYANLYNSQFEKAEDNLKMSKRQSHPVFDRSNY